MQNELKSRKPLDLEAESRLSAGFQDEYYAKQRIRAKSNDSRILTRTNGDLLRTCGSNGEYLREITVNSVELKLSGNPENNRISKSSNHSSSNKTEVTGFPFDEKKSSLILKTRVKEHQVKQLLF